MTDMAETRSVIIERELPHPLEKIWRALTQPQLIEEWLMKNDFQPLLNQSFELRGDWGSVACKVLEIEPNRKLVYSWEANGLESVVTWTLAPTGAGTNLRMEQSGFRADQEQFYQGARAAWPRFLVALEQALARVN